MDMIPLICPWARRWNHQKIKKISATGISRGRMLAQMLLRGVWNSNVGIFSSSNFSLASPSGTLPVVWNLETATVSPSISTVAPSVIVPLMPPVLLLYSASATWSASAAVKSTSKEICLPLSSPRNTLENSRAASSPSTTNHTQRGIRPCVVGC